MNTKGGKKTVKKAVKGKVKSNGTGTDLSAKGDLATRVDAKTDKKRKRPKENSIVDNSATVSASEEIDFPRGGSIVQKPIKDEQDEMQESTESPKKKRKHSNTSKHAKQASKDEINRAMRPVEILTFNKLTVGTCLLGQIQQIDDIELTVSLPNQLIGYVPITQISSAISRAVETAANADSDDEMSDESNPPLPDLRDLFAVGQWVRCAVLGKEGGNNDNAKDKRKKRRVELSLNPEIVNNGIVVDDLVKGMILSAVVDSVEDHGYILSFGFNGVNGFLHDKDAKNYILERNNNQRLIVGQLLTVSVLKVNDDHRTVKVTIDPKIITSSLISDAVSNIASLTPGNLVDVLITEIHANGLIGKIMGFFDGVINWFHVGEKFVTGLKDLESKFKPNMKIRARVIYTMFSNTEKKIGLSTADHVKSLGLPKLNDTATSVRPMTDAFPIGAIFEKVVVKRVDSKSGLVVEIENLAIAGYVQKSQISDEPIASRTANSGKFNIDSTHRARVVGYSMVDGLLQLSLRESVLKQSFLRHEDIQVGQVVKGTVRNLIPSGVIVSLAENITALAPTLHLSDVKLTHPELKFKPQDTVKCRVLVTNPSDKRVLVTLKKALVNSNFPIITSLADAKEGLITHAVITGMNRAGCFVTFYNSFSTFVPVAECSETFVNDVSEKFSIGQTIKCRVMSVDQEKKLLKITQGKVVSKKSNTLILSLQPSQSRAVLHQSHLSDHIGSHAQQLFDSIKVGDDLHDIVVIGTNKTKNAVYVSKKPMLVRACKEGMLPEKLEDVNIGDFVVGYVKLVTDFKVVVRFLGDFEGVAMRHTIADQYIATPIGLFHPFQTVIGRITGIDTERGKLELTLKPSETPISSIPYISEDDFIKTYFAEIPQPSFAKFIQIGRKVKAKVIQITEGAWNVEIKNSVNGIVRKEQTDGAVVNIGDVVDAIVLDVDGTENTVYLSTRTELLESADNDKENRTKLYKNLKSLAKDGIPIDAIVELVKEDYVVLSLPDHSYQLTFAPLKSYNQRSKPLFRVKPLLKIQTKVIHVPKPKKKSLDRGISLIHSTPSDSTVKNENSLLTLKDFKEGQKVMGTVTGVEKYGVFINIDNSRVAGLCHISKISDDFVKDVSKLFSVGQKLKTCILNIDREKEKIFFGLKQSYFEDEENADIEDTVGEILDSNTSRPDDGLCLELDSDTEMFPSQSVPMAIEDDPKISSVFTNEDITPLPLSDSWNWINVDDGNRQSNINSDNDSLSDATDDDGSPKKKKKKKKNLIEAKDITEDISKRKPESNADFERLLLGSPNSSYMWINYMAHQLNLSEIDKAREIAERALKTINYREEQEKMNVWTAFMNLENTFGTEETFEQVFKRALQSCDPKQAYFVRAEIYEQSEKSELAEQTYKTMLKKFSQSSKVWTKAGLFYMLQGKLETARDLLQRSLKSLPKHKHVKTISKFAQIEFKHGEPERGRTIFEGVMTTYPKRIDLWSIYIDMEIKVGDKAAVRRLFQRVTSIKFSSKKMKFIFKKWLMFEKTHGTEDDVEQVKNKAKDYVEGLGSLKQEE